MGACSACAGEYEDPDRTAWDAESSDQAEGGHPDLEAEEFPAKE